MFVRVGADADTALFHYLAESACPVKSRGKPPNAQLDRLPYARANRRNLLLGWVVDTTHAQHALDAGNVEQEWLGEARPLEKISRKGGELDEVYFRLRQSILNGSLAPGAIINQVHIAKLYGVSRTPVREALRMLQAENLVEAQFQLRMRVTAITPLEVDSVYATWILVQSLGTSLTVPRISAVEMDRIRTALSELNTCNPARNGSPARWHEVHANFHHCLLMHAGPVILESIANCWSRSERARRAYMRTAPQSWLDSEAEHTALADAYAAGDAALAVYLTSRQLARIARIVIGTIDPAYDPVAIRHALTLTSGLAAERR